MKKAKTALPAAAVACLLALLALLAGCSPAANAAGGEAGGSSPQPGGVVPDDPAFENSVAGVVVSVGENEITVSISPARDGGPAGAPQRDANQPPQESGTRPGQNGQPAPAPVNDSRDIDTSDQEQATYKISDQTEIKAAKRDSDGKLQEEAADLSSLQAGVSVRISLSKDDPTSAASITVMEAGDMGSAPGRPGTGPSPSSPTQRQ